MPNAHRKIIFFNRIDILENLQFEIWQVDNYVDKVKNWNWIGASEEFVTRSGFSASLIIIESF